MRVERSLHGEQPLFLFVALADHDRRVRDAVKLLAHLHFDERALLLDHDDEFEALGEVAQFGSRNRPGTADLEQPDTKVVAFHLVDAELIERLAHVEIALADRDDADPGIRPARRDDAVELVRVHEGQHRVALVVVQARFHVEDAIDEADVEPARRHLELILARNDDLQAVESGLDNTSRFDGLMHAFERRPTSRRTATSPSRRAHNREFLHTRRVQDRNHHVDEMELGLVRGGGGFRRVVVAHQGDHAAVLRRAGEIGMAEHVAGAIDARALAVPHAEHAVVFALAAQLGLLRAPDRGGCEVLV